MNEDPNAVFAQGPIFSPEYQSTTVLNITQPLLKGFGGRATLGQKRLAEIGVEEAKFRVRASAELLIAQILVTYGEVVFARERLEVQEDAVKLEEDLDAENQRRVEEAVMSPIEETQAEARRAEAMEEVVAARVLLRERENRLLGLTQSEFDSSESVNIQGDVQSSSFHLTSIIRRSIAKHFFEFVSPCDP